MTKKLIKFLLSLLLLSPVTSFAQGQFTTIGTDFWLGYNSTGTYYEIKIVSTAACTVTLDFTDGTESRIIPITGAGVTGYVFTSTEMTAMRNVNTGVANKSVHITSTAPVGIYAINQQSALTDATAVLPVTNYGVKYIAIDGISMNAQKYIIIATENGTKVTINGVQVAVLNRGQVYTKSSTTDLTGDIITSTAPVAFFNVTHALRIPNSSISYTDQAFEQLPPVSSWGKEFLVPVTERKSEMIRVVGSMDGTEVEINGISTTINTGTFIDKMITSPTYISADKPVGVCTYMVGSEYLKPSYGDPSIAWVPSINQHMKSATIAPFAPLAIPSTSTQLDKHWGQVIVPTDHKNDTKVNGGPLSGGVWIDGPIGSGLSVYNMPFTNWDISYTFTNDYGLVLLGYGTGSAESYQYLAASSSRKLNAYFSINGLHYEDANLAVPFDCGTPFNFEAVVEYDMNLAAANGYIRWFIDGVEDASVRNQLSWIIPYFSGGNHRIELWITDSYNQVEKLATTLDVECSTGMNPRVATICEGASIEITLALGSGVTPVDLPFTLSTLAGSTATSYSFPSSVTMLANTSSVIFTVSTSANKLINETDKLLKLQASASGYPDLTADITIEDCPVAEHRIISLVATPNIINEPSGASPNASTVTVALPTAVTSAVPVRVNLSYTGTATYPSDYVLSDPQAASHIDIPALQNSVSFTLTAVDDFFVEGDETVIINGEASSYTMQAGASTVTITIKDYTLGDLMVKKLSSDAAEPSTNARFWIGFEDENVTCTNDLKVTYSLSGTAVEGRDYQSLSPHYVIIQAGNNGIEVEIKTINNYIVEGARTVIITILSVEDN